MCAYRWTESYESCSFTKHFQENDFLFLWTYRTYHNHFLKGSENFWHLMVYRICLPKIINEIRRKPHNFSLRQRQIYTARETIDYLKNKNICLMSHCPYFPDLSPNDFSCSFMSNKKYVSVNFHHLKKPLMPTKAMFLSYQLQSRKTVSRISLNGWRNA